METGKVINAQSRFLERRLTTSVDNATNAEIILLSDLISGVANVVEAKLKGFQPIGAILEERGYSQEATALEEACRQAAGEGASEDEISQVSILFLQELSPDIFNIYQDRLVPRGQSSDS